MDNHTYTTQPAIFHPAFSSIADADNHTPVQIDPWQAVLQDSQQSYAKDILGIIEKNDEDAKQQINQLCHEGMPQLWEGCGPIEAPGDTGDEMAILIAELEKADAIEMFGHLPATLTAALQAIQQDGVAVIAEIMEFLDALKEDTDVNLVLASSGSSSSSSSTTARVNGLVLSETYSRLRGVVYTLQHNKKALHQLFRALCIGFVPHAADILKSQSSKLLQTLHQLHDDAQKSPYPDTYFPAYTTDLIRMGHIAMPKTQSAANQETKEDESSVSRGNVYDALVSAVFA